MGGHRTTKTQRSITGRPQSVNSGLPPVEQQWLRDIEACLSPDLLKSEYRKQLRPNDVPTRAHCYVATEAAYYLFGIKAGYLPHCVRTEDGGTHWWLLNPETKLVADPTESQTDGNFDYSSGRHRPFRQKSKGKKVPSKRAQILIARVMELRGACGPA